MIVIKNAHLRKLIRIIVPFLLIPLTALIGANAIAAEGYAAAILIETLLSLLFFIAGFERKKTGTRRLILVAVMTALSVTGRFIPLFKPVTALTILTAMYLGGEAGFLTGALSAVISNFYFGQGPWTPFQMLAWGLIGLIAGVLSKRLQDHRWFLLLYGAISGVAFSFIMDIWTVLWYNNGFNLQLYLAALVTAAPYTILYAVSNMLFLYIFAKPFGSKLARVKLKYGV